jgi:putative addiction module component (TIGR02574 family)
MTTLEQVRTAALALSPAEREALAADLVTSLEKEPGYDEAWDAELRRRVADIDSGRADLVPWEEARARLFDGLDS